MTLALAILGIAAYIVIAALAFRYMHRDNEDLKAAKHYKEHPERYGVLPVWVIAVLAILWPLQIVGFLIYICGGYRV